MEDKCETPDLFLCSEVCDVMDAVSNFSSPCTRYPVLPPQHRAQALGLTDVHCESKLTILFYSCRVVPARGFCFAFLCLNTVEHSVTSGINSLPT